MNFLEKVEQYICEKTLFSKEDRVFVACSGGVDSLTLLYTLKQLGYDVFCGHVHHGLRETAGRDEAHVKACCEAWGIPFYSAHVDVNARVEEKKESVEEAARNLRYEALLNMASENEAQYLALAQHAEDEAETVLFQLIRGSGLRGMAGMASKSERHVPNAQKRANSAVYLVRPFLFLTKEEIASFAVFSGLKWVEDESNEDDEYSRNQMRHHVIPALKGIRADSVQKILDTTELMREADGYFKRRADEFLEKYGKAAQGSKKHEGVSHQAAESLETKTVDELLIPCGPFLSEELLIQQYVLRSAFAQLSVPLKDKTKRHIEALRELFSKGSGAQCVLPDGLFGVRSQDYVRLFVRREKTEMEAVESTAFGTLKVSRFPYKKGDKIPDSVYTKWVDCDKIKGVLSVRKRTPGDRICLAPNTTKKLQDLFVDAKIPNEERDKIPVISDEEKVVWIVGHRLSADVYVTDQTKTILEITYEGE